jgi:hypothetical protein
MAHTYHPASKHSKINKSLLRSTKEKASQINKVHYKNSFITHLSFSGEVDGVVVHSLGFSAEGSGFESYQDLVSQ